MAGAIYTGWAACCRRCSPVRHPSPARPHKNCSATPCGDRPPPLRNLRPEAPLAVEQAIEAALAKKPEQRFGTAAEFATALGTPSDTPHGAKPRPARTH